MEKTGTARFRRFCTAAVLILSGIALGILVIAGFWISGHLSIWKGNAEAFRFIRLNAVQSILVPLAALGTALCMHALLTRFVHVHLSLLAAILWGALTSAFILCLGTLQVYDAYTLMKSAEFFARGNYKMMEADYFNACSYQLSFCLPMEIIIRLFPKLNVNLFMQILNVIWSVGAGMALTAFTGMLVRERHAKEACAALLLMLLPAPTYCIHVYGTIPMMFFTSMAFLFYAQYIRTGEARFGVLYALMLGLSYFFKVNTGIVLVAFFICSALDALRKKSGWPILYTVLAAVLSVLLVSAAIWQYEVRSGVKLRENVSTKARFVMGLQTGVKAAGWYNGYIEQFFPAEVTPEMEEEIVSRDMKRLFAEMKEDPKATSDFYAEKYLSQWLEPSCNVLRYGQASDEDGGAWNEEKRGFKGPLGDQLTVLYKEGSPVRNVLESMMHGVHQMLLVLMLAGIFKAFTRRDDILQTLLPLIFFGAVLYHLLFEAKSQYAYPYIVYMVPVAAQGLCWLESGLKKGFQRLNTRREKS